MMNMGFLTLSANGGGMSMIIMIVLMFAIMYLLVLRPQQKEQKKIRAMLASMEVGDSVVTTSGFYGKILDMTDEDVIVEFGNNKNCRIPMRKGVIAEVEKAADAYARPETKDTAKDTRKEEKAVKEQIPESQEEKKPLANPMDVDASEKKD